MKKKAKRTRVISFKIPLSLNEQLQKVLSFYDFKNGVQSKILRHGLKLALKEEIYLIADDVKEILLKGEEKK